MKESLRSRAQFQRVYNEGRKAIARHMVAFSLDGVGEYGLGIVASKKVGDAVRRNRAKRLLREAVHAERERIRRPQWLVLVARRSLIEETLSPDQIATELRQVLTQIGAVVEGAERRPC